MKNIVVFASGSGTNFINIYRYIKMGKINGKVKLLISNNPECGAIKFARDNNIDFQIINKKKYVGDYLVKEVYQNCLDLYQPDLILLAGFIKKIPSLIVKQYKEKIINIHPSLLPKYGGKGFYGLKVHKAVLDSEDKVTGVTIHFVDEQYDTGLIIAQNFVDIKKNDTPEILSKRVLQQEYKLYPKVIQLFCENKIMLKENKVVIK